MHGDPLNNDKWTDLAPVATAAPSQPGSSETASQPAESNRVTNSIVALEQQFRRSEKETTKKLAHITEQNNQILALLRQLTGQVRVD